ncbi:ankyrin repeat domain-containing protein [Microcoleus sp. Pol7_A1]|uniref:ankyrin repeat domain-containing protein n=1 Tax=Microcoleus sp. Pol7_A1 TaxID=2818893 RepID=UPI002FCE92EF
MKFQFNYESNQGDMRLHEAIAACDLSRIQEHIENGIDVNQLNCKEGSTPLTEAVFLGHFEIIKILIEAGANLQQFDYQPATPLGMAAELGNIEAVQLLLRAGADVNAGGLQSPLDRAVSQGHINVTNILINAGADVNSTDEIGFTPLMIAALSGDLDVVQLLVEAGANVNAVDEYKNTALRKASENSHQDVFNYLYPLTNAKFPYIDEGIPF